MIRFGTILVREMQGIRRFLYPLTATLSLPQGVTPSELALQGPDGKPVPSQSTPAPGGNSSLVRIDFAISMEPYEEVALHLGTGMSAGLPDDPLDIKVDGGFVSRQRRVRLEFDRTGSISQVVYDGIRHLRGPFTITRNGEAISCTDHIFPPGPLAARLSAQCRYGDGCRARTALEITACKSWVVFTHILSDPGVHDLVSFTLPLEASSPLITCDFGPGGGLYGKLQETASPVVWQTDFSEKQVHWSLATAGRLDYQGTLAGTDEYRAQCWFHWIDRDKSLAVAILSVPKDCRHMTANLSVRGDVALSFELGSKIEGPAVFRACYHFLNDIPPVSAATNPQSILLPPVVEYRPGTAI